MEKDASLETPKDAGKGESGVVRRWLLELSLADKAEKEWRKISEKVLKRYKGESSRVDLKRTKDTFNILWSNTETLLPSMYNSTPAPDVRRRFRDEDKIGKIVAEMLERSLSFSLDTYDFDRTMKDVCLDYVLPGRGIARVRYNPTFGKSPMTKDGNTVIGDDGEPVYPLAYETTTCEHVQWDDFRRGPAKRWKDVPWIAFKHNMSRQELVDQFGTVGNELELNDPEDEDIQKTDDPDVKGIFKTAEIWEIWDRQKREVHFICKTYKKKPLLTQKDPLKLEDFFPVPKPVYSVEQTDSLVPIPEFTLYETLADELDNVTARINKIIKGLKLRGVYDSTVSEFSKLFQADDNELIPAENVVSLLEKGGIEKSIWMLPIEKPAQVLVQLYQYREVLKNAIYEITGLSDIIRGSTNASETATAQQLKSQWGTLRLQNRQKEIARFARDILRIKAEIIAEKFQPQTLMLMTGMNFPTQSQKQMAQVQMSVMSAMGQPPDPKMQEMLMQPAWEEIQQVMKDDALRAFRIDIETDSTIASQLGQDQKNVTELMTAIGQYMQQMAPAMQSGAVPMEVVKTLLMSILRRFKLGNDVEDAIAKMQQQPQGMPPEVQKQIEDAKKQYEQGMQQIQQGQEQLKALQDSLVQEKNQLEMDKMRVKFERDALKMKEDYAVKLLELQKASANIEEQSVIQDAVNEIKQLVSAQELSMQGLLDKMALNEQKEDESEESAESMKKDSENQNAVAMVQTMHKDMIEQMSKAIEAITAPRVVEVTRTKTGLTGTSVQGEING